MLFKRSGERVQETAKEGEEWKERGQEIIRGGWGERESEG